MTTKGNDPMVDGRERSKILDGAPTMPYQAVSNPSSSTIHSPRASTSRGADQHYFRIEPVSPLCTTTTGGYQLVLGNRLQYDKLLPNGLLDIRVYPATFVHDILMLPGSLAQLLDKESETDIIDRMTPAVLRGYRALVHPVSKEPHLVVSPDPNDIVRGMVIFGQGSVRRSYIQQHYQRQSARRARAEVSVETMVPIPKAARSPQGDRWAREPTVLPADIYVCAGHLSTDFRCTDMRPWTLEHFLSGAYCD